MVISTPEALQELCHALSKGDYIAIDTEFLREKTYYARLCLIQVANDDVIACVDPLALQDLTPLWEVFFDTRILKVLHASRQDLEIIHDLTGRVPTPIFDTQIAATVAGHEESIGYSRLVESICGEQLDKTLSRTDWSRRPLSAEHIRYAEDDVRHLRPIFKKLRAELIDTGRMQWLEDDFEYLSNPALYTTDPQEMFRKVKRGQMLRPKQLAVLRELAAWREAAAMKLDKPRKWLIDDDSLFEIARHPPATLEALALIRGMNEAGLKKWGKQILAATEQGLAIPENERPQWHERRKLKPSDKVLADLMMAVVRQRGLEHGVAPSLLATSSDLEAIIAGDPEAALRSGWRARLVGNELGALLAGHLSVHVEEGKIVVKPTAGA